MVKHHYYLRSGIIVLLTSLIALCIVVLFSVPALAEESEHNCGVNGDNLTWSFDSQTGVLTITGSGDMQDYSFSVVKGMKISDIYYDYEIITDAPWFSYRNAIKHVVLKEGVTSIGKNAFNNCTCLASVTIPDSVTYIGTRAFFECDDLVYTSTLHGVTHIGEYAFYDCKAAFTVWIPDGETCIDDYAFLNCSGLVDVVLPDSVKSIGNSAFSGCSDLLWVKPLDGVTSIGYSAFSGCSSLMNFSFPDGVNEIKNNTFSNCESLTSISIPDHITRIGDYAFFGCTKLREISIPDNVSSIGRYAFTDCGYYSDEENWEGFWQSGMVLYIGHHLIATVDGKYEDLSGCVVRDGTKSIAAGAFDRRKGLISVDIPASVMNIGEGAFSMCDSLFGVYIRDIDAWCRITFEDYYANPMSYATHAFSYVVTANEITSVIVPDDVQELSYTFCNFNALSEVILPNGITSIGTEAFYNCNQLSRIVIPNTVASVEEYAFHKCTGLKDVFYTGSAEQWQEIPIAKGNSCLVDATRHYISSIDDICDLVLVSPENGTANLSRFVSAKGETITISVEPNTGCVLEQILVDEAPIIGSSFTVTGNHTIKVVINKYFDTAIGGSCGDRLSWAVTDDATLHIFGSGRMQDYYYQAYAPWYSYLSGLQTLDIGNGVISIGDYAFANAYCLKNVAIPNSVESIGERAFTDCTSMSSLIIKGAPHIGNYAFSNCHRLKDIYFYGTGDEWDNIEIGTGNSELHDATKHYISSDEDICSIATAECQNGVIELSTSVTAKGETITVSAKATTIGYGLDCVLVDGAPIEGYCFVVTGNHTVSALFKKIYNTAIGGICGDSMNWAITDDNVLHIYGTGAMTDYEYPWLVPWDGYRSSIVGIDCSGNITSIGDHSFRNFVGVVSITIPNTVTKIGSYAFNGCNSLSGVVIPSSVISIGDAAFVDCSRLESITVDPENTAYISDEGVLFNYGKTVLLQFPSGNNTANYTIPYGVTSIGDYAFYWCKNLNRVVIPDSVTSIGRAAFYSCTGLTGISIPYGVNTISAHAFGGCCSMASVAIADSIFVIGDSAFASCSGLKKVFFVGTSESWNNIAIERFNACLTGATIHYLSSSDDICFITLAPTENGTVSLSESITAKGETVYISAKATAAGYYGVEHIYVDGQEIECNSFTVADNHTVAVVFRQDFDATHGGTCGENLNWAITEDGVLHIFGYGSMADYDYTTANPLYYSPWNDYRDVITGLEIGEGATGIGNYAFYNCGKITKVLIPSGVMRIGRCAFSSCANIEYVAIPCDVAVIEEYAFSSCPQLVDVFWGGTEEQWLAISIDDHNAPLFNATRHGISSVDDICILTLVEPENGTASLSHYVVAKGETITITANATAAGYYGIDQVCIDGYPIDGLSFEAAKNHTVTVKFRKSFDATSGGACGDDVYWAISPDNVLHIFGSGKMDDYSSNITWMLAPWDDYRGTIVALDIGEKITGIGEYAFCNCKKLTSVILPLGITSIGKYAFDGCSELKSINIPDGIQELSTGVFYGCSKLTSIELPTGITEIGEVSFSGCSVLTNLKLPNTLVSIGPTAFRACRGISEIVIPEGVKSIGNYAFADCSNLSSAFFTGTKPQYNNNTFPEKTQLYYSCTADGWGDVSNAVAVHDFCSPSYVWNGDHCTASVACKADHSHVISETVTAKLTVINKPTKQEAGSGTLSALFENEMFEQQSIDTILPQITLIDIEITTAPIKTTYIAGELLDVKGMVVKANFSDGTTEIVQDYSLSPLSTLQSGDSEITITYGGKSVTQEITVLKPCEIVVSDQNTYTVFLRGIKEPCTVAFATYNDGQMVEVLTQISEGDAVVFSPSKTHNLCNAMVVDTDFRPLCSNDIYRIQ